MTNHSAMTRARSMIELVRRSMLPGLAERNKAVANAYIASLLDCGLIDRNQFEDLTVETELALNGWTIDQHLDKHI